MRGVRGIGERGKEGEGKWEERKGEIWRGLFQVRERRGGGIGGEGGKEKGGDGERFVSN